MTKKILITNDDGIDAPGLLRLAAAAREFGDVWVVAPALQCSAASHSITLRRTIDVFPVVLPVEDIHAFAVDGTPADCVRLGCLNIVPGGPDVVLSGINLGYNAATDLQYSATVGAAFEGEFQGKLSIALSEGAGGCTEVADAYLSQILEELLPQKLPYGHIFNVNFPDCPLSECKGILRDRAVSHGVFFSDRYNALEDLPGGGTRYMVEGYSCDNSEEGTDFRAIMENYVSVSIIGNIGC